MATFAQIHDGYARNVVVGETFEAATSGVFNEAWVANEISAGRAWAAVPVGTLPGAKDNGDGTFDPPAIPEPKPNNAGNPYFGKNILVTKDFFALAGRALGARYPRLRNDPAFLWVFDVLNKVEFVDVDDRQGQFLAILTYLTTTNADDGQKLMSAQDVTNIMSAWTAAASLK